MLIRFKNELKLTAFGKKGEYSKTVKANTDYVIKNIHYGTVTVSMEFPNGVRVPQCPINQILDVRE